MFRIFQNEEYVIVSSLLCFCVSVLVVVDSLCGGVRCCCFFSLHCSWLGCVCVCAVCVWRGCAVSGVLYGVGMGSERGWSMELLTRIFSIYMSDEPKFKFIQQYYYLLTIISEN